MALAAVGLSRFAAAPGAVTLCTFYISAEPGKGATGWPAGGCAGGVGSNDGCWHGRRGVDAGDWRPKYGPVGRDVTLEVESLPGEAARLTRLPLRLGELGPGWSRWDADWEGGAVRSRVFRSAYRPVD